MTNPLYARIGKHGQRSEKRVAKAIKARQTPGSGAFRGHKGDMTKGRYLAEAKATVHNSMVVKLEWLVKITQEATIKGCVPLLTVSFVNGSGESKANGDWIMMPLSHFNELNEENS